MSNDGPTNNPPDKLDHLVAAIAELNQTMDTRLGAIEGRQSSMEAQLNSIDARQNSIEQGILNLGVRSEALENKVEGLQRQLTDFSSSVQTQLTSMASDIRKLDRKFDLLNEDVMEVRADQRDLSRRQDNLERNIS